MFIIIIIVVVVVLIIIIIISCFQLNKLPNVYPWNNMSPLESDFELSNLRTSVNSYYMDTVNNEHLCCVFTTYFRQMDWNFLLTPGLSWAQDSARITVLERWDTWKPWDKPKANCNYNVEKDDWPRDFWVRYILGPYGRTRSPHFWSQWPDWEVGRQRAPGNAMAFRASSVLFWPCRATGDCFADIFSAAVQWRWTIKQKFIREGWSEMRRNVSSGFWAFRTLIRGFKRGKKLTNVDKLYLSPSWSLHRGSLEE